MAGRILVTGHDADFHCSGGQAQCHFVRVAVDYVRAGAPDPAKPVLILDHDPGGGSVYQMEQALDLAYGGSGPPRTVVEPRSSQFDLTGLTTDHFSAILVASDESCGGCDLNDPGASNTDITPDSDGINRRAGDIAAFFNQGGGLFFASGAAHGDGMPETGADVYYDSVPLPLGGLQVSDPFELTPEGRALGLVDDPDDPGSSDINCCATHNSFQEPPAGSPLQVAERDSNGAPETLFGDGAIDSSGFVQPAPPPPPPPPVTTQPQPEAALAIEGTPMDLTGGTHRATAVATRAGAPLAGLRVVWAVAGQNPASGQATTGSDGKAKIAWKGTKAGRDTLTAFADLDGNGARGGAEPAAALTVDWLAAPTVNKTANVEPISGTVLIKLPKGTSAAKYRLAPAAATSFVKLTQATQIPLGSTLDTTRGRVELQSAIGKAKPGKLQNGQFDSGRFQLLQRGGTRRPITEMVMNEPLSCQSSKRRGKEVTTAKRKRSRRLWGNGKGRFRTRGRYASATVRGTQWLTKDSCTTTTTTVRRGTVVVKDFAARRTVTVKKGKRYVARARRR